ncbi:MAG: ABC transporter permease [Cypionkella sp.]
MTGATVDRPQTAPASALRRLLRRKLALLGLALIVMVVGAAVFAPLLAPFAPDDQMFDGLTLEGSPLPPDARFLLGTDLLGRDLLSRILYGAQTSLIIGVVANGLALLIGTFVGITAGYFRGWAGAVLMRFTDLMMAFPALLLAICLAAIFKPSLWIVAHGDCVGELGADGAGDLYRNHLACDARFHCRRAHAWAQAPGASSFAISCRICCRRSSSGEPWGYQPRCCWRPRCSFLGVGVQPPTPSWGNIIFENQTYFQSAPWLVFIPGAAIILLALAFNLVGDALRDVLDPTQRGRD